VNQQQSIFWIIIAVTFGMLFAGQIYQKTSQPNMYNKRIRLFGKIIGQRRWQVGSIAYGIAKKLYFKEGDFVKQGDLLVDIDIAIGDREIYEAKATLERAKALAFYAKATYERQKALYEADQISLDEYQQFERNMKTTEADVQNQEALLSKRMKSFNTTKIYSPGDGIITKMHITEGQLAATLVMADKLMEIENIDMIQAELIVPVDTAEHLLVGQEITISLNNGKDVIHSTIKSIEPLAFGRNALVFTQPFKNEQYYLKPPMVAVGFVTQHPSMVHEPAQIVVPDVEDTPTREPQLETVEQVLGLVLSQPSELVEELRGRDPEKFQIAKQQST